MSKNTPKIPKALTTDFRKKVLLSFVGNLQSVWNLISKKKLEELHGILELKDYIKELENVVYEKTYVLGSMEGYTNKLKCLKFNLRHNGVVLFSSYFPEELSTLSSEDLGKNWTEDLENEERNYYPLHKLVEENEKKKIMLSATTTNITATKDFSEISTIVDNYQKNIIPGVFGNAKMRSMLKCRFCGPSAYVDAKTKQTRSADEGETVFAECTKCRRKWKLSS